MTEALAFRSDTNVSTSIPRPADSRIQQRSVAQAPKASVPASTMDRLILARQRLLEAAYAGDRIRTYEVALDLDMSEFHFARQFRIAFACSPHVFYDRARADRARVLLDGGMPEGAVARRIGLRRPAELRALLAKRALGAG